MGTDYLSHPDWVRSPRRNWKGPLLYLACCHHNPTSEGTWWCPYFSLLLFSEGTTDTFCSSLSWKGSCAKRYHLYLQFLSSPQSLIGARWLTGRLACCYHVLLQLSSHECFTIFAGRPDLLAQYSFVGFFCFVFFLNMNKVYFLQLQSLTCRGRLSWCFCAVY